MDISTLSGPVLIGYLDKFYTTPRDRDLDVRNAIELVAKRRTDAQSSPSEGVPVKLASP